MRVEDNIDALFPLPRGCRPPWLAPPRGGQIEALSNLFYIAFDVFNHWR